MQLWQFFISHQQEILQQTLTHLVLAAISTTIAILIGVSTGLILTRYPKAANQVIGVVSVIQTIPSVALLGFLLPLLGIGSTPAIVALFLYALLPILRNTYTGIEEVDSSVTEAAKGMGMPNRQILLKVELPLAMPVIFAGIRTATVATVGIATLSALIGSGGLGTFIFRGIALNNVDMILAGAIPAAALAILLDFGLGLLQPRVLRLLKPILVSVTLIFLLLLSQIVFSSLRPQPLKAGFTSEFVERADGYPGLQQHYDLSLDSVELDPGLMYEAIREKKVDVVSGFTTDGRIDAYNLTVLEDDQQYFPPYYAAPLVRGATLRKYPQLQPALAKLAEALSDETMIKLNDRVDRLKEPSQKVVQDFLKQSGFKTTIDRQGKPDIVIGSKNFTEQYLLAEMMGIVIENSTDLDVELKTGLAGTKICFDALKKGAIDLYPEYTGTGLLVILQADETTLKNMGQDREEVFKYVQKVSKERHDVEWLASFGFNNSYALMMRTEDTKKLNITSISDLKRHLESL